MLELQKLGANVFEFGNQIRAAAFERGVRNAFDFPGFVEVYLRPSFSEGRWPLRCVALSGDPSDLRRTDDLVLELFPENAALGRWIRLAREHARSQGLPARSAWLGRQERILFGRRLNDLVAKGELKAPFVIACESVPGELSASALPKRRKSQIESDIIAGGPLLSALLELASGASWASFELGGGSESIGIVSRAVLVDGSAEGGRRVEQVLANVGDA
jgi:urocanate hydratase